LSGLRVCCQSTATTTGTPTCGPAISDYDIVSVPVNASPSIHIDKRADVSSAKPGQTITYTYDVTNTGNVDLSSVEVTDDNLDVKEVEVKPNSIDSGGDEQ